MSDLTTEAFAAALRRFIARRGCPTLIWSDHGSNFVGAKSELKALRDLSDHITQGVLSNFCSSHNIQWKYIPEKSPHFGGIWESAVKSVKTHLRRIVSPVKLTFEEFTTVLAQIEACLNSRPLTPVNSPDDDGIAALTPGHFLVGRPLTSLPDSQLSYRSVSLLRRWHLCQQLVPFLGSLSQRISLYTQQIQQMAIPFQECRCRRHSRPAREWTCSYQVASRPCRGHTPRTRRSGTRRHCEDISRYL